MVGHRVLGPVGFGADGAVWAARDATGQDVVVSVLAAPEGSAMMSRLAAVRQGTHPHLARIRQVLRLDDERCAVVSDRVSGPTLATVVAARGRLGDGELAGLVAGIGSALGHLHERGVVHGDVAPANVIITETGRPVLVDLTGQLRHERGTPGFAPPERARGAAAGAAGDVWALGRLLEWASGGSRPRVSAVARPALARHPQDRPSARDIASGAATIAPVRPIEVPPPAVLAQARMRDASPPTERRPASRAAASGSATEAPARTPGPGSARRHARGQRLRARLLLVAVGAAVVTGAVVVGVLGGAGGDENREPTPTLEALAQLLTRRDAALAAGDPAALAATTVPESAAAREHAELLDRLEATGTALHGLRTEPTSLVRSARTRAGAVVDVVLVQHPYERRVGARREPVPAQQARCARLDLVSEASGWRLVDSRPCP